MLLMIKVGQLDLLYAALLHVLQLLTSSYSVFIQ